MHIEWDDTKNIKNIAKHGVSFECVAECDWGKADIRVDIRREYSEVRYVAIIPLHGRLHHITFTMRDGNIRVISFRKANKRERKPYEH
jgi:uncharacterized protein